MDGDGTSHPLRHRRDSTVLRRAVAGGDRIAYVSFTRAAARALVDLDKQGGPSALAAMMTSRAVFGGGKASSSRWR